MIIQGILEAWVCVFNNYYTNFDQLMIMGSRRPEVRTSQLLMFKIKASRLNLLNERISKVKCKWHRFTPLIKFIPWSWENNSSENVAIMVSKEYYPPSLSIREPHNDFHTILNIMLLIWAHKRKCKSKVAQSGHERKKVWSYDCLSTYVVQNLYRSYIFCIWYVDILSHEDHNERVLKIFGGLSFIFKLLHKKKKN